MNMRKLAVFADTAFGLGFDVDAAPERMSGFKPARSDVRTGKELFADLRLEGFASLLRIGFARQLILIGGNNYGEAIREMLTRDFGISSDRVLSIGGEQTNTSGDILIIRARIENPQAPACGSCALVSNFYHLPRTCFDMAGKNLSIPVYPAEAFWLFEDEKRIDRIAERLGGGSLAERVCVELQGIVDKLSGTYRQ
ncbi:MAG: YdcF family protein [Candidatus Liptonbacteria bacterium]|nr:YdcF family protein [Candidatus Liptonbacteria bacterium]